MYLLHQEGVHQVHVANWRGGCGVMGCLLAECAGKQHPYHRCLISFLHEFN